MPSTLSPNMSLILPTVGQEPGPNWALDLNSSLSTVDQHDHSAGSGVQITPAGMNINTDLSFGSNNALSLRSVRMNSQLAPLALGSDTNCIYVSNGNLFYNDDLGNQVQITAAGAVNGTPGSIGNLIAPAAVTYVPANQTFVFESNQGNATPGSLDAGNLYLRNIVAAGNYIQLQPNAVLPASYSLTLPSALPAASKMMRLDNLGNISATLDVDNVTLEIVANVLKVVNNAITPIGSVTMFAGSSAPTGWLFCNGQAVSRATYSNLFATIGTTYGNGDGVNTFNLPNFVGIFPRGAEMGGTLTQTISGITYTGGSLNTKQTDNFQDHIHYVHQRTDINTHTEVPGFVGGGSGALAWYAGQVGPGDQAVAGNLLSGRGGAETRPANIAIGYIIKT